MSQATELIARQMAAGSANARVWADILYNVKLYGAKGDWNGTTGTDDTAAIQATIDAAIAAGGKAVFFPHGTYKVTTLTNVSSVVLFGDNAVFSGITNTITQIGSPVTTGTLINVNDFGAKGDGLVDDTASIQSAIDYCKTNGQNLLFPPGTYRITGNGLLVTDRICIKGEGGKTVLKYEGTGTCIKVTVVLPNPYPFWFFEDFNISVGVNGSGIDASGSESLTISRVNVYYPGYPTINRSNNNTFGISGSSQAFIAFCNFENLGIGIKVQRQNVWVNQCYVAACHNGMQILAESVNIDNSHFYLCDRGVSTEGATVAINFVTITGCTMDTDNDYGIFMNVPCGNWAIDNCFISNAGGSVTVDPGIKPSAIYAVASTVGNMRISNSAIGNSQWAGHGIYLDPIVSPNNGSIIITGCNILTNKGSGIIINNIDTVEITGCWIGNNTQNGITGTGSTRISITGGYMGGNATNISLPIGSYTASNVTGVNPLGFVTPPASPLVSGTVYQNTSSASIEIHLAVKATTPGTKGNVALALGDTATVNGLYFENVSSETDDTHAQLIRLLVPPGWYYRFSATASTFLSTQIIGF